MDLANSLIKIDENNIKRANNFKNITGFKFGMLTVIKLAGYVLNKNRKRRICWYVCCDCGTKDYLVRGNDLITKRTYSCGCINVLRAKELGYKKIRNSSSFVSALKAYYTSTKQGAKSRGIYFHLNLETFFKLTQLNCYYCGEPPSTKRYSRINIKKKNGVFEYFLFNGVDRVDSSVGYDVTNVNPCCTVCNLMKSKHREKDFLSQIKKIHENQCKINRCYPEVASSNTIRSELEVSRKLCAQKNSFGYRNAYS